MIAFYEQNQMPIRAFQGKDMNYSAHLHRQAEFFLVGEGEVTVTVNGESCTLRKGDLLTVFPNAVHSYQSEGSNQGIMVIFNPTLAGELGYKLTKFSGREHFLRESLVHSDIPYCMESILHTDIKPEQLPLIKGYLLILVSRVCACLKLKPVGGQEDFDLVHRALLYVTGNFKENLTLERVARELGISRSYLSRIFSKKVGSGFNQYVNSLRVGLAQHLLENPTLSVSQVALECGFESLRTFNRAFQEHVKETPRAYRKQFEASYTSGSPEKILEAYGR